MNDEWRSTNGKSVHDLRKRTKGFALRILRLYATLPRTTEAQVVGKQLLRSGTSVGAHYREAYRARSTAEFVSKLESGGENVASAEVERVIYGHPAVLECAVIPVPDEAWGEVGKAFVALKAGQRATEPEILGHCREHLAGFKVPKSVEFMETLPKGGTGKILKKVLREKYWAEHERKVN